MIDLQKYIGSPIVLITNEYEKTSDISGIRLPGIPKIAKLKNNKFILCRNLTTKDLESSEFYTYIQNMWTSEELITTYLTTMEIHNR